MTKAYRIQEYDDDGPWWAINFDAKQLPEDLDVYDAMRPLTLGWGISEEARAQFCTRAIVSNLKPPSEANTPPDLIIKTSRGPLFLSPRARAILEQIEPRHSFVDVDVIQQTTIDEPLENPPHRGTYHCLHLMTFLDCIDYEATEWRDGKGEQHAYGHILPHDSKRGVVLKCDVIAGHHIWRGVGGPPNTNVRAGGTSQNFISAELLAAFDAAGLTRNWYGEDCEIARLFEIAAV